MGGPEMSVSARLVLQSVDYKLDAQKLALLNPLAFSFFSFALEEALQEVHLVSVGYHDERCAIAELHRGGF